MPETQETSQQPVPLRPPLQQQKPEEAILVALPELPCPNCAANILAHHGFYNFCDETSSLREDSYLWVHQGQIYMEHDEEGHETDSHECRMQAFCGECQEELPWPLYEIRRLDGATPEQAREIIAGLIAEAQREDDPREDELPEPPDPPCAATEETTTKEVKTQ